MAQKEIFALLVLMLVVPAHFQERCDGSLCYPSLGDLMVGRAAQLSVSSTCGLNGPQNYCILGYLENEQKCFTCDSRRPYNRFNNPYSHQIENIITTFAPERKMRWWQSENGVQQVSIQLDLETMFQFSHLVLTFKSFRPAAMLVERSKDFGHTWKVFRFFSADCVNDFPGVSKEPAATIDDLICDSRYSGAEPSTDGEVVFKALDPSFHIDNPYNPTVKELITMTNLRVNFTRLFTLGDNLLGRRRRNPQDKYYYALYEMVVRGRCFCNGHASQCMPVYSTRGDIFTEPGMVHGRCVCQHNTMGDNCEKCQDLYNDAPWRPAGTTNPHVCKRCNCNGHSERCHFDFERYKATGQVSGGVCDDCRNNRMGPQCEQCQLYHFRDPQRSLEDPHACISCTCHQAGSVDGGLCDPVSGRCVCKQNVEGEHCDQCKFGFYGLSQDDPRGCRMCRCNLLGTIRTSPCDQTTGQCICEHFAYGPECDQCVPGYWGLGNTVFGCLPCDCDIGGAFSTTCSPSSGQCQCRANMVGRNCSDPAPGHFLAPLDFYLYEAENAVPLDSKCSSYLVRPTAPPLPPASLTSENPHPRPYCSPGTTVQEPSPLPYSKPEPPDKEIYDPYYNQPLPTLVYPTSTFAYLHGPAKHVTLPTCKHYFRSIGYDFVFSDGRFVVVKGKKRQARRRRQNQGTISLQPGLAHQVIVRPHIPNVSVTWTGPGFVRIQDGAGLRFTITNIPLTLTYHLLVRYEPEFTDDWTATVTFVPLGSYDGNCPIESSEKTLTLPKTGRAATLDPAVCLSSGTRYHVDITFEKQGDPDPYCSSHILIDSIGLVPKMESLLNFCSLEALAQYQHYRCVELGVQPGAGTIPEVCERLVASMSAYIHNGAIPCKCNPTGSFSSSCSRFGGQCDCKPSVIGRCCDTCAPLTFGFGPNGCSSCQCEPSGSRAASCDSRTGQCPCRNEATGRRCDRCLPGYYGFPNCRRCQCNGLADLCDPITGVCLDCREHSTGPSCERCVEGYFGDPVSRDPCMPCRCPDVKGSERFFAHSCSKDPNSLTPTCECKTGYEGLYCDVCASGYYGNLLLPGTRCKECHCNNNIAPDDAEACDALTGECLRCLYNTQGTHCQTCRPGYYGNALLQNCQECSCDRWGTDATQCPLGSPCFCDQVTGQCPCHVGVVGVLCDRCTDGYWNMNGDSGCQPCNCHPGHSVNNLCDQITGQCPCEPEYGGKECGECASNYFGNPDTLCISCDCNMQGSIYPGCDPYTGECMCQPGVTGVFCDQCAPGHDPAFPDCKPCHPCFLLWQEIITSVSRATETALSLVPAPGELQPSDTSLLECMEELKTKLENLASPLGHGKDELGSIQMFLNQIRNIIETVDPYIIIIDSTQLLDTDINNIHQEFTRLLDELQCKFKEAPKTDIKALNDTLEKIRKFHATFMKDEERVKKATDVIWVSTQTRQGTKRDLTKCLQTPLDALEKKVKALSVARLNEKICGAPGKEECEKAKCGGALCGKCGGPSCTGALPVSRATTEIAQKTEAGILDLLRNITEADTKIKEVKMINEDIKDKAQNMKNKINNTMNKFEKDKNNIKNLIKRVREYLREETMEQEDIDTVASAVLAIQLPSSPDGIRKMIQDIQIMLSNFTHFKEDVKYLEEQTKLAKDIKHTADEILNRTNEFDVSEIQKTLKNTVRLHDKIKQDLNETENNTNVIAEKLDQSIAKINNVEDELNTTHAKMLLQKIEALKNKTELNRAQALAANTDAGAALGNATGASKDLEEVAEQFKKLTDKNTTKSANDEANERLKNIKMEAENMAKDVENKISQIEELEKRIRDTAESKENKMRDLDELRVQAEELWNYIAQKVENYFLCTN
ncbi:laminin subunit beta-4 [Electrophorus electricus]|uniref:laminin subunit beta-4 n=1 Tax=Electrophorus electricus TaxID=8005 RepID=UPI0015CFD09F|nr:laminin subunit beta-4 [Electrophorus electricus]